VRLLDYACGPGMVSRVCFPPERTLSAMWQLLRKSILICNNTGPSALRLQHPRYRPLHLHGLGLQP
jgi:hypothetical protein